VTTLAELLRSRREALQPADVGLPDRGRRRTPGLRREEVATLAGVSVDYLVRLEQGRDTNPSSSVLRSLADALRLSDDDRLHLLKLATLGDSQELCRADHSPERSVAPTVTALLDRLDPTASVVVGPTNDVLAWNGAWGRLVTPLGFLDGPSPNLARYVFLHAAARSVYPDWELAADEQVSRLRSAAVRWGDDEGLAALMDELHAVPAFAERWAAYGVNEKRRGVKRLVHPDLGELRLAYEVLLLPDDSEQRLVTWLPGDDATAAALALADGPVVPASPAQLRVVG
jgi:transcriptional regulator with XRE-family HTH domain